MKDGRRPLAGAIIEAAIAAGLIWFFAAIVFDRPGRAAEMAAIGAIGVFLVEFIRRRSSK